MRADPPRPSASFHGRLVQGLVQFHADALLDPVAVADLARVPEEDLESLQQTLAEFVPSRHTITGTLERRLLIVEDTSNASWPWGIVDLAGQPHATRTWPSWTQAHLALKDSSEWTSRARLSPPAIRRLNHPHTLLISLYHPEWFPTIRFPLAISNLAAAARSTLSGPVSLLDMQLGCTVEQILARITAERPDIVAISATFGQHDLLLEVLTAISAQQFKPTTIVGGSLPTRNGEQLLRDFPDLIVAKGPGEPTIIDLIEAFHGAKPIEDVRGIVTNRAGNRETLRIRTPIDRSPTLGWSAPELDLLGGTFERGGSARTRNIPRLHKLLLLLPPRS